jgi:hypothetical protein
LCHSFRGNDPMTDPAEIKRKQILSSGTYQKTHYAIVLFFSLSFTRSRDSPTMDHRQHPQ